MTRLNYVNSQMSPADQVALDAIQEKPCSEASAKKISFSFWRGFSTIWINPVAVVRLWSVKIDKIAKQLKSPLANVEFIWQSYYGRINRSWCEWGWNHIYENIAPKGHLQIFSVSTSPQKSRLPIRLGLQKITFLAYALPIFDIYAKIIAGYLY